MTGVFISVFCVQFIIDYLHLLCRNEGAFGFYKGIVPNLIRVTPACCITFVVYEYLSEFLRELK